ncbi:histidinol-phosphatase HisJ [Paenibacillus sp. HB172176]|uniref:histidinol-phosphatase HisJ n=1 Tax=Paenibacillus sp. HB172176 TaxID=2493690 RepID=UPI00143B478D|nr:histidinol-phosphatase HisJ [Paenibacillus sp. HB172176]
MLKWDGHTHSQFCYHGSSDRLEHYIENAVAQGFERYTISEHPPLPREWVNDALLMKELAMPKAELSLYMNEVLRLKREYEGKIEITAGLELDYLEGRFDFTEEIINEWQHSLEDVVFSVHFLPGVGGMRCIDFTTHDFRSHLLTYYGNMDELANAYYDHVEGAIEAASRLPVRTRLGHVNLIEKFRTALPPIDQQLIEKRLRRLLPLLEEGGVGVDVNTAGLRVATCGKPYVPEWFLQQCLKRGISCVYGSDSHKPEQVGFGYDWFESQMKRFAAE